VVNFGDCNDLETLTARDVSCSQHKIRTFGKRVVNLGCMGRINKKAVQKGGDLSDGFGDDTMRGARRNSLCFQKLSNKWIEV
jgi:hypothetical protein